MLTHRVPWPLQSGDRIRTFNIFNFLAARHEVALLSFADLRSGLKEDQRHLQPKSKRIEIIPMDYFYARLKGASALFTGEAISVKAFHTDQYGKAFHNLCRDFKPDCVYTDSSALAFYPLEAGLPFVADFMDVDSEKWRQLSVYSRWPMNWIYRLESRRLAKFEKKVAEKGRVTLVVSETEKARLLALAPKAEVCVVPNGVDQNIFHPTETKPIPGRLAFIGVMNYFPNVDGVRWFCRQVWPKVLEKAPHATFYIVGANPSLSVRALKKLPGVEVTGSVLDIRPYLSQAEVCVAPLRFSIGLQNKVIQSLAMGKAVVASRGAVQGLGGEVGAVLKVAETPETFAASILELLMNEKIRKKLEAAGPAYVAKWHDWHQNLKVLRNYF